MALRPQFSVDERTFITKRYWETHSTSQVQQEFIQNFPNAVRIPTKKAISYNAHKFDRYGKVVNRQPDASGRRKTARSNANIARVRRAVNQNPRISSRRNPLPDMSQSTFNRITRKDLNYHPYKIQVRHGLKPGDTDKRLTYCRWLLNQPVRNLSHTVIVDEANFYLSGKVTSSNVRKYAPKNAPPRDFVYDTPNSRGKLIVWMAVVGNNDIIGPYFFPGNVNARAYIQVINDELVPALTRRFGLQGNGAIRRVWFVQDGAPAHTARLTHDRLQQLFPGRVVGKGHPVEWPPRSPDLTPCDFFLWGYLKAIVYAPGPPANLQILQRRITAAVTALRRERTTRRAVQDMRVRAQRCIRLQGAQVEGRAAGV